jgi:hypothetical protein
VKALSIHRVVIAHIHRNDLPVLNQDFQRNAVRQIDRNRMQGMQLAAQRMQAQRRMVRIQLKQLQGFEILLFQIRKPFEKTRLVY